MIILRTSKTDGLVAKFHSIAPLVSNPPYEAMVWGERHFFFSHEEPEGLVYVEGMSWYLLEGVTAKKVT